MQTKNCKTCNETKEITEFGTHKTSADGYNNRCKSCLRAYQQTPKAKEDARWRHIKATYGLTKEDYSEMLKEHNGKCAICGNTSDRPLSIDHCHSNQERRRGTRDRSKIRGLLCDHCNHGLGKFFDNVTLLKNAVSYLKKYQTL